jgi:SAM-dependent methyltransferase
MFRLGDNHVDLVTCFSTLHHVLEIKPMLLELARILRPNGFLIIRENDCQQANSLTAKYLNFVQAVRIVEGVHIKFNGQTPCDSNLRPPNAATPGGDWAEQKREVIEQTKLYQYRSRQEWRQELDDCGFRHKASLDYRDYNLTKLFIDIFQLRRK